MLDARHARRHDPCHDYCRGRYDDYRRRRGHYRGLRLRRGTSRDGCRRALVFLVNSAFRASYSKTNFAARVGETWKELG